MKISVELELSPAMAENYRLVQRHLPAARGGPEKVILEALQLAAWQVRTLATPSPMVFFHGGCPDAPREKSQ